MTGMNPEAHEACAERSRSISPADLDAAAEFYDRLRRHTAQFVGRLFPSAPYEGFANRATWKLCSNVDGNPDLLAQMLTWAEKQETVCPSGCRLLALKLFRRPCYWYQVFSREEWEAIDWQDVARHWNGILTEQRRSAC